MSVLQCLTLQSSAIIHKDDKDFTLNFKAKRTVLKDSLRTLSKAKDYHQCPQKPGDGSRKGEFSGDFS